MVQYRKLSRFVRDDRRAEFVISSAARNLFDFQLQNMKLNHDEILDFPGPSCRGRPAVSFMRCSKYLKVQIGFAVQGGELCYRHGINCRYLSRP
jgi:hypothetical protein